MTNYLIAFYSILKQDGCPKKLIKTIFSLFYSILELLGQNKSDDLDDYLL